MVRVIENPRLKALHDELVRKVAERLKAQGYGVTYADIPGFDPPHLVNGKKPDIIAVRPDPDSPFLNIQHVVEVEVCGQELKRTEAVMLAFDEAKQGDGNLRIIFAAPEACMPAFKTAFAQFGLGIDEFMVL